MIGMGLPGFLIAFEDFLIAFFVVALCWALARRRWPPRLKLGGRERSQRAAPSRRTVTGDLFRVVFVTGYGALFVWQFVLGSGMGREAGFLVYLPLGLFPAVLAGAPWLWIFLGLLDRMSPADGPPGPLGLDLTVLSTRTLLYHALVFVSFAINLALIFKFVAWSEATRALGEGIGHFASREEYEAWKAARDGGSRPAGGAAAPK